MSNKEIRVNVNRLKIDIPRRKILRKKSKASYKRAVESGQLVRSQSVKSAPTEIEISKNIPRLNTMLMKISANTPLNSANAIERLVKRKMRSLNFLKKTFKQRSKRQSRAFSTYQDLKRKSLSQDTNRIRGKSKISRLYNLTRAKTAVKMKKKFYDDMKPKSRPKSCMKLKGLDKLLRIKQIIESPKPNFLKKKNRKENSGFIANCTQVEDYTLPRDKKYFDMRHLLLQNNYKKKNFKKFLLMKNEYQLDSSRLYDDKISDIHWEPKLGSYRFSTQKKKEKNCLPLEMLKLRKELLGTYDKVDRSVFFEIGLELLEDEKKSKKEKINSSEIWKKDKGINFGLDFGDKKMKKESFDVKLRNPDNIDDLDEIYPRLKSGYGGKERRNYDCSVSLLRLKRQRIIYRRKKNRQRSAFG